MENNNENAKLICDYIGLLPSPENELYDVGTHYDKYRFPHFINGEYNPLIRNGDYTEWADTYYGDEPLTVGGYELSLSDTLFDSSYEWIMFVIDKMHKDFDTETNFGILVDICTSHIAISCKDFKYVHDKTAPSYKPFDIKYIYEGVVKYIRWYNLLNK